MELPPKLWFKLQRLKAYFRLSFGQKEQHFDSALRMCPSCRGLIDRGASVCPLCDAPVRSARSRPSSTPGRVMGGVVPVPSTANSIIIAFTILMYAVSWIMTQRAAAASLQPAPSLGGISTLVLLHLGAKSPLILAGQWWRLVTAIFLHAGLIHIGFNLWCLFDVGPMVESLFCSSKYVVVYLVTGVFGYFVSLWWRPMGISIGASGAIMGLIGILIGASYHLGSSGKELRRQLWKWVIYIVIFGLLPMFSIDNAAHFGGFISGLLLGYLISTGEPQTGASEKLWNTLAILSVLVIAGSFALMALNLSHPIR
ncbi:MAG: rhomboid family intramembrane serine protease [Acidobacteriota bacterium]|nr:rhomboid family intramembrane serine protease [Acidobacteriota bacterium]